MFGLHCVRKGTFWNSFECTVEHFGDFAVHADSIATTELYLPSSHIFKSKNVLSQVNIIGYPHNLSVCDTTTTTTALHSSVNSSEGFSTRHETNIRNKCHVSADKHPHRSSSVQLSHDL